MCTIGSTFVLFCMYFSEEPVSCKGVHFPLHAEIAEVFNRQIEGASQRAE